MKINKTVNDVDPSAQIGAFWLENYSNKGSIGETYYDQIIVATRRIGPMSAGQTVANPAPARPANLTLKQETSTASAGGRFFRRLP